MGGVSEGGGLGGLGGGGASVMVGGFEGELSLLVVERLNRTVSMVLYSYSLAREPQPDDQDRKFLMRRAMFHISEGNRTGVTIRMTCGATPVVRRLSEKVEDTENSTLCNEELSDMVYENQDSETSDPLGDELPAGEVQASELDKEAEENGIDNGVVIHKKDIVSESITSKAKVMSLVKD
ncbi:hypothetical protein R1sor_018905 [Riccia sorocarpa]|uniref:Uncharacterized protein n=1 Tax=Riccia sorocarpa TaxID=122646 RepID=A0ABD3IB15_9MARC